MNECEFVWWRVNEWPMDEWMDGWIDGWAKKELNEWMNEWRATAWLRASNSTFKSSMLWEYSLAIAVKLPVAPNSFLSRANGVWADKSSNGKLYYYFPGASVSLTHNTKRVAPKTQTEQLFSGHPTEWILDAASKCCSSCPASTYMDKHPIQWMCIRIQVLDSRLNELVRVLVLAS